MLYVSEKFLALIMIGGPLVGGLFGFLLCHVLKIESTPVEIVARPSRAQTLADLESGAERLTRQAAQPRRSFDDASTDNLMQRPYVQREHLRRGLKRAVPRD